MGHALGLDPTPLGVPPEFGVVPRWMRAMVVTPDRYGPPASAYAEAVVPTPLPGPEDVLVYVMAAGLNYNGVWAAAGAPLDVVALRRANGEPEDYHVGGSDGSGIVWAVGERVTRCSPGDEVVLDGSGLVPGATGPAQGVLGYDANHGSFAQFARVHERQCQPRPRGLSWTEAATLVASGGSAWRMLHRFAPHTVRAGDVVLVWGGSGGLGVMAIQLVRLAGGLPVAVTSGPERAAFCRELGAVGTIDRRALPPLGPLPDPHDRAAYDEWRDAVRELARAVSDVLGERRSPRIVVEHPGEATLPASVFVCAPGGMVVTCGGTLGYRGTFDLRHAWVNEKRIQGSHRYDVEEARALLAAVDEGRVRSCTTAVLEFEQVGTGHQQLVDGTAPAGKIAVEVGITGQG